MCDVQDPENSERQREAGGCKPVKAADEHSKDELLRENHAEVSLASGPR